MYYEQLKLMLLNKQPMPTQKEFRTFIYNHTLLGVPQMLFCMPQYPSAPNVKIKYG